MMFSGRGGFGQPGTRRFVDTTSEVMIPVKQAGVATVAAFIVAIVIYAATVAVLERACGVNSACHAMANAALWWWRRILFWLALLAPSVAVFTSMLINVYDQSWTPDRKPQAAEDGPNAPGWLRRAIGWRGRAAMAEAQEYNAPTNVTPDRVIKGENIHIVSNGGRTRTVWNFELPESDLDRLRLHFFKCRRKGAPCGISVRDLEAAGFSKGKEGRARAVAEALRVVAVKDGKRVVCLPEVVTWVIERKYAQEV